MNKVFIIKNISPWMFDELLAFSNCIKFKIVFLRIPPEFYKEDLEKLRKAGIEIYTKPFKNNIYIRKILFIVLFFLKNFEKFFGIYNAIIGFKSLFWFYKLDFNCFKQPLSIHTQFATQASIIALLIKKYFKNQPEYSFTFHAYDIYFKNNWFRLLVMESYRAFTISEYNINYVKENYLNSKKLTLSRLGVFRSNINRIQKKETKIFTLGLLSWFVEKKGVFYLLKAFLVLKKQGHTGIKLILAGDGPLREEYIKFISDNNLSETIKYIGKIKGKQKEHFYNSINAFILPSISLRNDKDGIPVVLMEAIAYSLPIISTKVSGIPEICINDYNGYLIEERNVNEIVDSITNLVGNKNKMADFRINSLQLSKKYDIRLNSVNKLKLLNWI